MITQNLGECCVTDGELNDLSDALRFDPEILSDFFDRILDDNVLFILPKDRMERNQSAKEQAKQRRVLRMQRAANELLGSSFEEGISVRRLLTFLL